MGDAQIGRGRVKGHKDRGGGQSIQGGGTAAHAKQTGGVHAAELPAGLHGKAGEGGKGPLSRDS